MAAFVDNVGTGTVKTKGQGKNMQGEQCVGGQGWRFHLHASGLILALRAVSSTVLLEERGGAFHPQ